MPLFFFFFCNFSHYDFNCQHEVFYPKIGYFLFFFKYVKGFSSSLALLLVTKTHMMHTFHLKPNDFSLLCFTFIFFFTISSCSKCLLNKLYNRFVEQMTLFIYTLFISHLLLPSAFLLYLSPPFLSHSWKKACSKLSSALAYYKLHCRHLRKCLPAAANI